MAEGYSAGEASIKIVPDASGFLEKLKADLKAKEQQFKVAIDADTAPAERSLAKTKAEASKPVRTQLELDLDEAQRKLRELRIREEAQKLGLKVNVEADTTRARLQLDLLRAQAEAREITIRVNADPSGLKKTLSSIGDEFGKIGESLGSLPLLPAAIFTGIGELPAATTAITNVVGALQQLSGAGAAVPGILGGIVSEVGTVKLAMTGIEDAFKAVDKASDGSAKNIAAANEALAKLAPQAADFVQQVSGLKPAFDDLTKGVQGNFFDGLGKSVRDLATADLPTLNRGLGGIATALNGSLKQLGVSLSSGSSQGILDRIFGNTKDAQTRLTAAIDPLIKGIGTLTAAGSDVLPRLADDIGKVSQRFSAFITEADKNGTLNKFINDGITGFEHLGSTGVNIAKILNDITGAAGGDGGLLKFLDEGSKKLHDFLSSTEGQNKLKEWFAEGRRELDEHIIPLLKSLPGLFTGIVNAASAFANTVVPPLRDAASFLSAHPDGLKLAIEGLIAGATAIKVANLLSSLQKISELMGGLGKGGAGAAGGFGNKLALGTAGGVLALGGAVAQPTDGTQPPSGLAALSTIGGGALLGAQIAGPIGAAFGTLGGAAVALTEVFLNQANKMKDDERKLQDVLKHRPPAVPGLPVNAPVVPGAAVQPGNILGPARPELGPPTVKGLLLGPAAPVGSGSGGELRDLSGIDSALAGIGDKAAVAKANVDLLANGITTLPTGEVVLKDNTPDAIQRVKDLGYAVTKLPNGQIQITVQYMLDGQPISRDQLVTPIRVSATPDGTAPIHGGGRAEGGVLPGYSPGVDNMLVPMSGGEGVIIPTVTRKLGPAGIAAINSGALTRGYAGGGILKGDLTPLANVSLWAGQDPKSPGHGGVAGVPAPGTGRPGDAGSVPAPWDQRGFPSWWQKSVDDATFPWWWNNTTGRDPRLHPGQPGYAGGGIVDEFGNPVTPGPAPGQAGVAPNPYQGGGIGGIFSKIVSGVQGPIGNALSIGTSLAGAAQGQSDAPSPGDQTQHGVGTLAPPPTVKPSLADRASTIPGLWGAIGSAFSSDPGTALTDWGTQTGKWLGNFTAKTAGSFGSALWSGALGLVGLDNSILSPNNPWTQAATGVGDFALSSDGPVGKLVGADQSGSSSGSSGSDTDPKSSRPSSTPSASTQSSKSSSVQGPPLGATTPKGSNESIVYQSMLNAGYPASEWPALKNLLNGESGFRSTAQNPSSTAYGMFQFLDSTWSSVGASKTSDPAAQTAAGLAYIKQRYGSPSAAWSAWQSRSPHWYSSGGAAAGPGGPTADDIPALLSSGEHVFTAADVAAMGGQKGVYAFRSALHRAAGGPIALGNVGIYGTYPGPTPGAGGEQREGGGGLPGLNKVPDWWDKALGGAAGHWEWWMAPWNGQIPPPGAGQSPHKPPTGIIGGPWDNPNGSAQDPNPENPKFWPKSPDRSSMWGFADGGAVTGYVDPRQPLPRPPDAKKIAPRPPAPSPSQISPRQSAPSPSQIGPPQLQPPATSPAPAAPPAQPPGPSSGGAGGGGRQTSAPQLAPGPSGDALNHNLPAIRTGIASAATTLGNIASQAIAAGMGGAGIPGGGAAGQFAAGLFQQGGKIVDDIVNVGSSFLVGSVPGSFGTTTPGAYGETLRTPQNVPHTAQGRGGNSYQFNGMDVPKVFQELDLRDNIAQQAALAHRRTR